MKKPQKLNSQRLHLTRIEDVKRYIQAHIDEPLNMLELADVACFSMFHFQRLFALYTGFGVAKDVLFLRLKKACWQLAFRQHMSMMDIALSCGFNDQHSFSREFKRDSGLSP